MSVSSTPEWPLDSRYASRSLRKSENKTSNGNEDNYDNNNDTADDDNNTDSDNNNNDNTDNSSGRDNDDNDNNEEQFLDEDLDKEITLGELRIAVFQQKYKKRWTRSNMRRNI